MPGITCVITDANDKLPEPSFCKYPAAPVILTLPTAPKLVVPETDKLANVPVLVILGCALVVTVPAVVARVAFPFKLPINVVALILPLALKVPSIFAPVLVITNTLLTPLTPTVTLPFGLVISTLLVPFTILSTIILPAVKLPDTDRLPTVELPPTLRLPAVDKLPPVIVPVAVIIPVPTLPIFELPDTETLVNVPILVMLGCALVVTVPDVVALDTVPETLAPVTLLATAA